MLRSQSTRPLLKGLARPSNLQYASHLSSTQPTLISQVRALSSKRPTVLAVSSLRPITSSLQRYATNPNLPYDKIDSSAERKSLEKALDVDPKHVSGGSSVRHVFEHSQAEKANDDDMLIGIKGDLATIKKTFALDTVPKESLYLGGAGLLPYIGTSLSTVYLAFDINHAKAHGEGFLFTPEKATELLHLLEPIQIGYGAVIISFLGAIHWGLEYAGYGGHHGYPRYAVGVIAPAVAWPTLLMPVEYALITQFLAFNFLYFHDARATVRGWCPPWYSTYRFVLTFIVGASIVASLIGRGQIAAQSHSMPGPADKMKALRDSQWENLEKEERERRKAMEAAAEDDEEEEEEEEESDEGGDDEAAPKEEEEGGEEEEEGSDDKDDKEDDKKDESGEKNEAVDSGKGAKDKIVSEHKSAGKVDNDAAAEKEKKNQEAQAQKEGDAKESAAVDGAKVKGRGEIA